MRKFITFGPAFVVLLTTLVMLLAAPAAVRRIGYAHSDAQIQLARADLDQESILKQIDRATRAIANAVEPSVVHIAVSEEGRRGTGSGWVYDDRGHIVTNSHVVRGSQSIRVQFQDGRAMAARIVGEDRATDVAIIKVDTQEGLFPAKRGTGVEMQQGDRVYAFGSPFGFKFSMSEGIVSGLGRDPSADRGGRPMSPGFTNYIQTDAAVNPGNSGGPLVNVEGRVIGMNVAIATAPSLNGQAEGQNSGISFAIPLATIEAVAEQLISGGTVVKGYLGVGRPQSDEINSRMLASAKFRGRGVFLESVMKDGPADAAGIRAGDIVTKINGSEASNLASFRSLIANNLPGGRVQVEAWRNGDAKSFEVTLGRLLDDEDLERVSKEFARVGFEFRVTRSDAIVVVATVAGSPAFGLGLLPGTKIKAVEGEPVPSLYNFASQLRDSGFLEGKPVRLTIETALGESREITMPGR